MNRRHFLAIASSAAAASQLRAPLAFAQTGPSTKPTTKPTTTPTTNATTFPSDVRWHDVRDFGLEGRGFDDTADYFDRLPARAKGVVRDEVWNLSRHTAGMCANFETDATTIYVRYTLLNDNLAMAHMPATGVSGVDLYAKLDDGAWRWAGIDFPKAKTNQGTLVSGLEAGRRAYRLNLPLYNGVTSLEIGVPAGATFVGTPPRKTGAILFYGTSITQGGCASRPGMAFVNILGRRLDRPMFNFGFSGNGWTETEVGAFLAELKAAVFVLDCMANMLPELVHDQTVAIVRQQRDAQLKMPILLLEDRNWASGPIAPARTRMIEGKRAQLRRAFETLKVAGVSDVHYQPGDHLIGTDGEGTVDGSHPSDLGMMRYADALEPVLRQLITQQ